MMLLMMMMGLIYIKEERDEISVFAVIKTQSFELSDEI